MAVPPPYKNGYVPTDWLIVIARGWNQTDKDWEHRLPRATLRRWRRLVARALKRTGRTLWISSGWATDRPYWVQVIAKQIHGNLAATPGTSSHGGIFEGKRTAAIDAGNWAWVYENHGGYDAWLSDLRAEGFDRLPAGYPLDGERHHIIDYHCWDDVPAGPDLAGLDSKPFVEDDMTQQDVDEIKLAVNQIRDVIGAQGGLNMPGNSGVLAHARAAVTIGNELRRYLFAGGEEVTNTIGSPDSVFGLLIGQRAQIAGLAAVVAAFATGEANVDAVAVEKAAYRGAMQALEEFGNGDTVPDVVPETPESVG